MTMSEAAPYLVAILAMLFSALSAVTLITAVRHFDPLEVQRSPAGVRVREEAAV
jgi:hypothetical protein